MSDSLPKLPLRHVTVRVPWHDSGWDGRICRNCTANSSCMVLPRIAKARDDEFELAHAGQSIENFERDDHPPCVDEHGTILSPAPLSMEKRHPYAERNPETHGHFAKTPYVIQPFSAAAVPYGWMLQQRAKLLASSLKLDFQEEREPELPWTKENTWVQEGSNQRAILDGFFSALVPEESLVFFYAKRTPLADDSRRVIVGVGRIKSVGSAVEYAYMGGQKPAGKISGYLWERNLSHSIRPQATDGFLLPYQDLLEKAENDESIDLAACVAFSPDEYFTAYSYGTEHLPHDGAIASLLRIEKAIKAMRIHLPSIPWEAYLKWIDGELNRLWRVRGPFPGLGPALNAFGLPFGNLLAWHVFGDDPTTSDPWDVLTKTLSNPARLPAYLQDGIGSTWHRKWEALPPVRRSLLQLIARFELSDTQALRWYQETERDKAGIRLKDEQILKNPYLLYEEDRLQPDAIAFELIDRGLFPPEALRQASPLPEPSRVHEAIDPRRLRALVVVSLEEAGRTEGHTCLPSDWLVERIRERPLQPSCPLDHDTLTLVHDELAPKVGRCEQSSQVMYRLDRYKETSELISSKIRKRKTRPSIPGNFAWADLVDSALQSSSARMNQNRDQEARQEKTAALEVLFRSGVTVLMGAAGTGKSTLLKALCGIDSVRDKGILLLAPTGKARIRLEQASGMPGQGKTIAQFLNSLKRYDGRTGRYFVNASAGRSAAHATVVIDECSMLTEEQLAAVLDAVEQVDRLILVGDPRQLPPIGAGRPFVDIVRFLKPEGIETQVIRVGSNYAELTVTMRQSSEGGSFRDDVLLAQTVSGQAIDAASDEIWNEVACGRTDHVKSVRWDRPEEILPLLRQELREQLGIDGEQAFEESLGGVPWTSEDGDRKSVYFNTAYRDRPGASRRAEDWQILAPTRQFLSGTNALNRSLQQEFRAQFRAMAATTGFRRQINPPAGPDGIIYGDKVINVINKSKRKTFPDLTDSYVANGDIGIVTGSRKRGKFALFPGQIEVEFATQPGFAYKFWQSEFDSQEATPPLELAYALTVHKTQGSEFGTTFVVVPNPCRNLSREMLYTALTRQRDKVVILHQGEFKELMRFGHEGASEISRRMTALFQVSNPVRVEVKNKTLFLDQNLVYLTENGELVRSKSEWIIADKLKSAGIRYQYEQPLMLDGIERYPDFTIRDDDSGQVFYWEHNGMLSNEEYAQRWERKKAAYRRAGIALLSEELDERSGVLLVTEEGKGASLELSAIQANIDRILGTVS